MSAHPSARTRGKRPLKIEPRTRLAINGIVISWRVARAALAERAPAGTSPVVVLELRIDQSGLGSWSLVDPTAQTHRPIDTPTLRVEIVEIQGGLRLDSDQLCAHILSPHPAQPGENDDRLVYVRSDIFKQLGITGGRYEPTGCAVERR